MQNRKTNDKESKLTRAIAKEAQAGRSLQRQREKIRKLLLSEHLKNDGRASKLHNQEMQIRKKLHYLKINKKRQQFSIQSHEDKISKVQNVISELDTREQDMKRQLTAIQAGLNEITNQLLQDIQGQRTDIANAD
jgi:ABC-type phosphate transport system auxiliary subunit